MNIEINNIDWKLLREQKEWLLSISDVDERNLDGVLNLIDHIQDQAVEQGVASEEIVFGAQSDEESLSPS